MPTTTVLEVSGTADGHVFCESATWATAHSGGGTLTAVPGTGNNITVIGASLSGGNYFVNRSFVSFPVVATGGATISGVTVRVFPVSPAPTSPTNHAKIVLWTRTGATGNLATSDFVKIGSDASSTFLMSDVIAAGASGLAVSLNSTGIAAVKVSGSAPTRFALISEDDYTNTAPTVPDDGSDLLVTTVAPSTNYQMAVTYSATPPTFSSITPNNGTTSGGTSFSIGGTNFATGATVTIGGVPATGVAVPLSTVITGDTGPHPAVGVVDVVVTNSDGGSVTGTGAFTYTAGAPTALSVSPPTGTTGGGSSASISGSGFASGGSPANSVTFGGVAATSVVVISDSLITCLTPAHAAGAVDVIVVNPNSAGSSTIVAGYTYTATPPVFTDAGSQLIYDFNRQDWFSGAYGSLQMLATDPTQGAPKVYALTAGGALIQAFDETVPSVTATGNAGRGFLQTMPLNLGNSNTFKQFHGFVMVVNDVTAVTAGGGVTAPWQAFLFVDNVNNSTPPIQVPLAVNINPYNTMPVGTVEGGNTANNAVGELIGYFNTPSGGPVDGHNAYLEIYYPQGTPANTPTSGSNSGPLNLPWAVYRMDVFISQVGESKVEP